MWKSRVGTLMFVQVCTGPSRSHQSEKRPRLHADSSEPTATPMTSHTLNWGKASHPAPAPSILVPPDLQPCRAPGRLHLQHKPAPQTLLKHAPPARRAASASASCSSEKISAWFLTHPRPGPGEGEALHLCTACTKPELSPERWGGIWVSQPSWAVPTGFCIRCPQVPLPELSCRQHL